MATIVSDVEQTADAQISATVAAVKPEGLSEPCRASQKITVLHTAAAGTHRRQA
jgi:hypothetical protein